MWSRWILGVAFIALSLVGAAGCGGGSETSDVTKADFVKQANEICDQQLSEWRSTLQSLQKKNENSTFGGKGFAAVRKRSEAAFDATLLPAVKKELDQLEQLEVPAGDEAKVEKMLQSLAEGTEELEKQGVEGLLNGENFATFQKEADAYGLNCRLA